MSALVNNKKAFFNYEILEKFQAGIELLGHEVKSLRKGQGSLDGSYVTIRGGEAFLMNATIPPYQPSNTKDYDPLRMRKLLLTKDEIRKLADIEKGLTIVPISVYTKGPLIKVSVAVARGKKQFDKRASTKARETARSVRREFTDR